MKLHNVMKSINALLVTGCLFIIMLGFRPLRVHSVSGVTLSAGKDTTKIDAETGLVNDANLMMVKSQCIACHSSKLILQHRFTRAGWLERIRWMQKYHKLWDLGESEKVVLDYLEKNYGPQAGEAKAAFRRAPLKKVQWYTLH